MNVSIITPARNAAATLERTIRSVLSQTIATWELLIVDNGSTDATVALAQQWAARDLRIRVLSEPQAGVSRARNRGVEAAWFDWLMFLDADDTLAPRALETLTHALTAQPSWVAVRGEWDRMDPAGEIVPVVRWPVAGDLFPFFAYTCVFAIHSCVIRRAAVIDAGFFDPALKTCEDWDLWQRIARTGAHFGYLPDVVAYYHMRRGSASNAGAQLARDGIQVIRRGHAGDARVKEPAPAHAAGEAPEKLPGALYHMMGWCAGLTIGSGDDAAPLLDMLTGLPPVELGNAYVADCVLPSILLPDCRKPSAWPLVWPEIEARLVRFLAAVERQTGARNFRAQGLAHARRVVHRQLGAQRETLVFGGFASRTIETTEPIPDLNVGAAADRIECRVTLAGVELGTIELPVCDGRVPAFVLADAIAARWHWQLLEKFLRRHRYPRLRLEKTAETYAVWHESTCLVREFRPDAEWFWESLHNQIGWTCLLQDLWDSPAARDAELRAGRIASDERATIRRINDARVTLDVTELPLELHTALPAVQLLITLGGAVLCSLSIEPVAGRIAPELLRARILEHTRKNLSIVVAREAVLGRGIEDEPASLRERLIVQRVARARAPETELNHAGAFIARRAGALHPRRATLPAACAASLARLGQAANEPVVFPDGGPNGHSVAYLPDLVRSVAPTARTLRPAQTPRSADAARGTRPARAEGQSFQLPILMYHRVAPGGSAAMQRYRVHPDEFEQHLRTLRQLGYRAIGFSEWADAAINQQPLPGRAVMLTFDDGYLDFYTHAWPLLREYGFGAMVFLVAQRVGSTNAWDAAYGETLRLMDWRHVLELQRAGIQFGAHTCTHPFLTSLSPTEIVDELARSRAILVEQLGHCDSLAYPFGDADEVVHHLAGACGYNFGVTCEGELARFEHELLQLPRWEVRGDESLETFRKRLMPSFFVRALRKARRMGLHRRLRRKLPDPLYEAALRWCRGRMS